MNAILASSTHETSTASPLSSERAAEIRALGYVRPAARPGFDWVPRTANERDLDHQAQALDKARADLLAEVDGLRSRVAHLTALLEQARSEARTAIAEAGA